MAATVLEDEVAEYLAGKRRRSPATVYQYSYVLEKIWLPWCEAQGFSRASEADDRALARFTDYLESRPRKLSIHSIRTYLRSVRLFLKAAGVAKGSYTPPKAPGRLLEVLSRSEVDRLEDAASDERDRLVVRVLADSGLRISELLGLKPADLRENKHDRTYGVRVIGKGDKEREVPLPQKVYVRLRHYADHGELAPGGYIFRSKRARPGGGVGRLTRSGAIQLLHNLGQTAGIGRVVYPHLLRHSYATWMLSRGTNPVTLQKIMGHANLTMISQTYSHLVLTDTYAALIAALEK